jgi:hypothetical protein
LNFDVVYARRPLAPTSFNRQILIFWPYLFFHGRLKKITYSTVRTVYGWDVH